MSDTNQEEVEELGEEGEEGQEPEEPADVALSEELIAEHLCLLCKTGNGLSHAYVRLELKSKALTDIAILNCFTHVRYLDLSGNKLKDISAVNALSHLLTLKVDHNLLTSAKLEEFLQVANFSHNAITSTEGIAHPLLETLNLSFNKITELRGINRRNLPYLRSLDLHSNQLSSVQNLEVPTLQRLYLAANQLDKVECLENLSQLTTIHLRENKISTLDGFPGSLESLQYMNLRGNAVESLSELDKLKGLPMLRALVLSDCPVSEVDDYRVETLVRLRKLERLDKEEYTDDERTDAEELSASRAAEEAATGGDDTET